MTKTETRLRAELDDLLAKRPTRYHAVNERSARIAEIRRILKGFDDEWAKRLRDAQKKGGYDGN